MKQRFIFASTALAALCLAPLAALAQDAGSGAASAPAPPQTDQPASPSTPTGEITLGAQWVGGVNTDQYGRYNGFTEQGVDVVGGFSFSHRDQWDSGKTFYYDISGDRLDFQTGDRLVDHFGDSSFRSATSNDLGPESEVHVSLGNQGKWGIDASYNAISYTGNIIDSIYAVSGTTGILNGGLAPWGGATNSPLHVGATTSFTTTSLSPFERQFQTGTRRDILQFSGHYLLDGWTLTSTIRHEHKEGTLEESIYETYGGQAFTLPIDYDTDRFDLSAAYKGRNLQALVQYTFLNFQDNNLAVSLPRPASVVSLSATSGPFAQTGLYALPPSNSAHYLTAMVSDSLAPGTRLTLNGRFGAELQNDTFPANSADPNLSSSLGNPTFTWFQHLNGLNQGTSAPSADAVAWIYQGNVAVDSNLSSRLEGRASYNFDGRDVHLNQFKVWIGGSSPDATANTAAYVVPQNWFNQTAKLELVYNLRRASNTKLTLDYSFNAINRTNAQVEHSVTNTFSVQLNSMIGSDLIGSISYDHADRNGTLIYGTAWGNLETGSPEVYGTPSGAYYQAPMVSDSVILRGDYAPPGKFTASLYLKYVNENYSYPAVPNSAANCAAVVGCASGDWTLVGHGEGIKNDYNLTVGPSVSYRPSANLNLDFYYAYERIFYNDLGNGACAESNTGLCAGSAGYFQNTYSSGLHTAGFNGEWQATPKLKLSADYNMSVGTVVFGEFNGVVVANVSQSYQNVTSYPDINSRMYDIRLTAAYKVSSRVEWALIYQYSVFHNDDWDDLTAPVQASTNTGTGISILTPGYSSPNYAVSLVRAVVRVKL